VPIPSPGHAHDLTPALLDPDPARAQALDQRMRDRLADSLAYVATQAGAVLRAPGIDSALTRLRAAPVDPLAFGAYYDLVLAIEAEDFAAAQRHLDDALAFGEPCPQTRVIALGDPATDPAAARYARLYDTDPQAPFRLAPPAADVEAAARLRLAQAFDLLDRGYPRLAQEVRALLRVVILAAPDNTLRGLTFDGASSFMLWGAIALNAEGHSGAFDLAQALVHESGHNLLFGLAADGPLVDDDGEARYASPLRADPRPLDGILHATFVCARMHEAVRVLVASGTLARADAVQAERDLRAHADAFRDGFETVHRHARLTPLGREVLDEASRAMAAARAQPA